MDLGEKLSNMYGKVKVAYQDTKEVLESITGELFYPVVKITPKSSSKECGGYEWAHLQGREGLLPDSNPEKDDSPKAYNGFVRTKDKEGYLHIINPYGPEEVLHHKDESHSIQTIGMLERMAFRFSSISRHFMGGSKPTGIDFI